MEEKRQYICIDLKSFYASVECVERGLDPFTTNLIVADPTRTDKTICLAASPAIKKLGVPNRCRVFQIPKNIKYIMAPPRMQLYLDYSAKIYGIYLKYFAPEDIHVYSVDEAFMDVTHYLSLYKKNTKELAITVLNDIKDTYGLTATCGIGTNLYLAKIALDITAKHAADFIGELDEESFKASLWDHLPLTDFWMIGRGTVSRLAKVGIFTMRDIAMADEYLLFRLFGVNAELIMDHAWGLEPTTIADIKKYKTKSTSISSGQVLTRDYNYKECRLIVKEMCDLLCLDLVKKHKVTGNIGLTLGFSFGVERKPISASEKLTVTTSSNRVLGEAVIRLFDRIADPDIYYRRVYLFFNNLQDEAFEQFDLFTNPETMVKDRKLQQAALDIKSRYGKNAILKGMNLEESATTIERNGQIGGHKG
ncbi:MAG: DNA repair protein [Lachnospiraceae bacterium]|nr:DNA repair protein [Lachnospiraceae bacterium]